MSNIFGLLIFALGVALLIANFAVSQPAGVQLSQWVQNYPALRSFWLLALGGLAVVAGLGLAFWGSRRNE
ncbi:MAG TPA: DUF3185 family protein [Verrucomicrobiae bacterium]|nr:DUF3185 family protein [Verrucomicrobiae bacterium]